MHARVADSRRSPSPLATLAPSAMAPRLSRALRRSEADCRRLSVPGDFSDPCGRRSHRCQAADRLGVVRSHISCEPCPAGAQERARDRAHDLTPCFIDDLPAGWSPVEFCP